MSYGYPESYNYLHNISGSSTSGSTSEKYRRKYKRIKRIIKDLVFKNAALCDQVSQTQEKILMVKEERRFLLKKLHHLQAVAEADNQLQVHTPKSQTVGLSPPSASSEVAASGKKASVKKKFTSEVFESLKMTPKMKKPSTSKAKKMVEPIPLDITGRPVYPIVLGGLTVHSLGDVVSDRVDYHTEDLIFPSGFCSTRVYGSLKDPEKKCVYTCKILDGGLMPRFEIVADSDLDAPLVGNSANDCHSLLLQLINHALGIEVVNARGRGPEFFGFSHPTIHNLIQSSPGARKLTNYKWSKFEANRTGEPPADENDASLSFEALQRSIAFSKSHMVTDIKEEPSDQLLSNSSTTLRDLLMS